MGQVLVPGKTREMLSAAIARNGAAFDGGAVCERLLAEAANENMLVSLLLLRLDRYGELNGRLGKEGMKTLADILVALLFDQTSDLFYIDCGHVNEMFVVLPSADAREAARAGTEILTRFKAAANAVVKSRRRITLSGGVSVFPHDASNRLDWFRHAREAALRAEKEGGGRIVSHGPVDRYCPKTVYYSQIQLERLRQIASSLGASEDALLRESLDALIGKYS